MKKLPIKYSRAEKNPPATICKKTVSGRHIWAGEIIDYTMISKDESKPNCMFKCVACGLYDDITKWIENE